MQAAALLRDGTGRYATVCRVETGDSLTVLRALDEVDVFLHDSDHSPAYEAAELACVTSRLTDRAVVRSDNAHATDEPAGWAERHGRRFLFFDGWPAGHWYPGDGIGVAVPGP